LPKVTRPPSRTTTVEDIHRRGYPPSRTSTVEDLHCRDYDIDGTTIKVDILDTAGNLEFPAGWKDGRWFS